jgi:tRNA dimethylallyltransferase
VTDVFLLGGPTASGKSGLAVTLALQFGMQVVSADAMMVYRGLDIGTAKPTLDERQGVPHRMVDVADVGDAFSVHDWASGALAAIEDAAARGVPSLVVGGTGFYLAALTDGLPAAPQADASVQAGLWERLEREGLDALAAELKAAAPEDAARAERNPRRVVRALEVLKRTGRPPSSFGLTRLAVKAHACWLTPSMDILEPRIWQRTRAMFAGGWADEAGALDMTALGTARQALGYQEARAVFDGDLSEEVAVERVAVATRRYAKRQRTWFAKRPAEVRIDAAGRAAEDAAARWLEAALKRAAGGSVA